MLIPTPADFAYPLRVLLIPCLSFAYPQAYLSLSQIVSEPLAGPAWPGLVWAGQAGLDWPELSWATCLSFAYPKAYLSLSQRVSEPWAGPFLLILRLSQCLSQLIPDCFSQLGLGWPGLAWARGASFLAYPSLISVLIPAYPRLFHPAWPGLAWAGLDWRRLPSCLSFAYLSAYLSLSQRVSKPWVSWPSLAWAVWPACGSVRKSRLLRRSSGGRFRALCSALP